jgi:adenylate kinase
MKRLTRIVITGNPGVGKHTCARVVSKQLGNTTIIDINEVVVSTTALRAHNDACKGLEVDIKKARKLLQSEIDKTKDAVIVGHLAPYVLRPSGIDLVIVLRRSPYELTEIFQQRMYAPHKMKENVSAEILGITLYDSLQTFGKKKIAELDATAKFPQDLAIEAISILQKKSRNQIGIVDWLALIYQKGDVQKLLEY